MDLETLSIQLSKDPESYAEEYRKVLLAYSSLTDVPVQSTARVKQFLNILSPYIFKIETDFPSVAVAHLQKTTDSLVRKELVRLLVFFYNKRLISPENFFELYLRHSGKFEVSAVTSYCGLSCMPVFLDYLSRGDDRQRSFAFLMVVYAYESLDFNKRERREKAFKISPSIPPENPGSGECSPLRREKCAEVIMANLFSTPKLIKIAVLYFLNEIDFCISEHPKIVEDIGFVVAEKLCRKLITNIRAKQDPREVRIQKYRVIVALKRYHGLDIRIGARLLRLVDPTKEDLKDVLAIIIDAVDEDEVKDVVDKVVDTFCGEHKDDEFMAYGLNILREFVTRFDIGDYVLEKINFRHGKNRGVFYAHSALLKTIKKGDPGRGLAHVRRKVTKEEKLRTAMEGRGEIYFKRKAQRKAKANRGASKKKVQRKQRGK